jgi:hypothetical protein
VGADEDQASVEKVLSGDTSAFEGIVHRWQGPLSLEARLARTVCGGRRARVNLRGRHCDVHPRNNRSAISIAVAIHIRPNL